MRFRHSALAVLVAAVCLPFTTATAQSLTPIGTWSNSPGAGVTFGGSGIVGPVMHTQVGSAGPWLTLGATPRYDNAPLTNNSAGTYFVVPGADACTTSANASCPNPAYARWNFNFAVTGENLSQYDYRLWYSIVPDGSSVFTWTDLPLGVSIANTPVPLQGSWNIGMSFLYDWGLVNGSGFSPANVNATGTYRYALVAYDAGTDNVAAQIAINVQTASTTVPEPSTVVLMGMGVAALLIARRRRTSVV